VEGNALDQPGDFLGCRLALGECDVHVWGFIFPRRGWHYLQRSRFYGDLAAQWGGRGCERVSEVQAAFVTTANLVSDRPSHISQGVVRR
jgi:hypothetical protein